MVVPRRRSLAAALLLAATAASLPGGSSAAPPPRPEEPTRGNENTANDAAEFAFPEHFGVNEALNFYAVESSSLLKRSMLSAGFPVDETSESSDSYLDFATRALSAEIRRVEKLRDSLRKKQKQMAMKGGLEGQGGTCSGEEDGECVDEGATKKTRDVDEKLSSDFGHFLTPDLQPGQADLLRWDDDGSTVQDYAARVGLPEQLVPTLIEYAKGLGLYDIMTNMLYDDPLPPDGVRWFSFQSPYQKEEGANKMRNMTWNVERPAKKWKSDMHWFNCADELAHEDALRALARGGFDEVLKGIGEKFGLDTLHIDSIGFVAVTNCDRGYIHTDWEDVDGRAFNFLVGIHSPEGAGPELVVEGDDGRRGETYYGSNAGVLVGDGSRHGTRECDHRSGRGVRITASIYLADVTEDNISIIAGDTTSLFPPTEQVGETWVWSQGGRHWRKEGDGGLAGDKGRQAFKFDDLVDGCTEEDCDNEGDRPRNSCLKTCRVFMDDDTEYYVGKERKEVFGY